MRQGKIGPHPRLRETLQAFTAAGVKAAQNWDDSNTALIVVGAAAVGIGIALAVSSNDDNAQPVTPVTTGTAP